MTKNTSKNYLSDIKEKYEVEKNGDFSHFLNNPTPVSIKDYCIDILKSSNSKTDLDILKHFFSLKGDEKDKSLIEKFDNDKFRPICNFFNGKTKKPKYELFDLMALLVDLKPRPLSTYLRTESTEKNKIDKAENNKEAIIGFIGTDDINRKVPDSKKTWLKEHQKVVVISSLVLIALLFIYLNTRKSEVNEWMEWVENHYEIVDWDGKSDKKFRVIIPKDDNLIQNFRKIIPCDTTKFERNGRVCLWYGNTPNGEVDFFTYHGVHPEFGKTLKEVTPYIMNKYGKGPCE